MNSLKCVLFLHIILALVKTDLLAQGTEHNINYTFLPNFDKSDMTKKYTFDMLRAIRLKHIPDIKTFEKKHINMDFSLKNLLLLLSDQGISEKDYITYKIYKRMDPNIYGGVNLDSLARIELMIRCRPTTLDADSAFVDNLRKIGSKIEYVYPPTMITMAVVGFFPIFKLEDIEKDTLVTQIGHVPYRTTNDQ